jgi:hypothetical protein
VSKNPKRSKIRRQNRRMRDVLPTPLLLVIGGIVILGGALFAIWIAGRPAQPKVPIEVRGSPSLRIDREFVDLGDVRVDKLVTVNFNLGNVGDQDLRFRAEPYVEVVEGC